MYSPSRYSKSMPACSMMACVPAARVRNPGRVREWANSPYAATRSASGGRDARLIWALAEASEVRSKDASRAAIVVDEGVEFAVGQGAGDPAPAFGGVGVVVVAGEDDFQGPVATDGAREAFGAATAGEQSAADLRLPEDRLLPAGVAQIEREGEFVPAAAGAPADGRDGDVGRLGELHDQIGPYRHRVLGLGGGEVGGGGQVEVVVEEVGGGAVEHHDLDVRVSGQLVDDLGEAQDALADDEVHGRVGKSDLRDLR